MLRIVDEVPDLVLATLQNEGKLRFRPLPEPEDEPADERTSQFRSTLTAARVTDEEYRTAIAALDAEDPAAAAKEERIERALRDRVRAKLGLPPRPQRRSLDPAAHARDNGIDPGFELPVQKHPVPAKHRDGWLQTLMFPDQLKSRVAGLARRAREVEQETGVTTLHLAFGFLEWFESDTSDTAFASPLLLLPVGLERHRGQGGEEDYRLVSLDDAPVTNLSLELRLRDDFRLNLPAFDHAKDPIEGYLRDVAAATRSLKRSRVRRYMTLAPFSFARVAMYRDLDPANWTAIPGGGAAAHPLVRPLLRGGAEEPDDGDSFASEYEIDHPEIEKLAPILVSDADSSQHSAIIDAVKGRNLVIEGPPGTGKSQTIANLIANVLHKGGRVLFVSEKMAALDVVKSRLEKVGLGQFCLALHAAGAKPSAVIEALREREGLAPPRIPAAATAAQDQAARSRAEIKAHLEALHAEAGPLGETVHAYIGRLAELTRVFPRLPALLRDRTDDLPAPLGQAEISEAQEKLETLETAARDAAARGVDLATSPFRLLDRTDLFPDEREALLRGLEQLVQACLHLQSAGNTLRTSLGRPQAATSVADVLPMAAEVGCLADPPPGVDRALLGMLATARAIEDALWVIQQTDALDAAASQLRTVNVDDPATLRVAALKAAIEFAAPLGVAGLTIDQVTVRAREANEQVEAWGAPSRTLKALTGLLGLPDDPEVGAIRLACDAARLAAEVDPGWHGHCRPGLERHLAILEAGASRQEALEIRMREVSARIDLDGVSHIALRAAGGTLRDAGFFSFLRADVREAKRLFSQRWRGGPLPRAKEWATELHTAADVLAEQDALANDAMLRTALGGQLDPRTSPLRQLARAAKWQGEVVSTLSAARLEAAALRTALTTLHAAQLAQLAALATPARALIDFLDEHGPSDGAVWSALRSRAVSRAAALAKLAEGLEASGLQGSLLVSRLGAVAAAHAQWLAATAALASDRARALVGVVATGTLRATVDFAQDIWSRHQDFGLSLLADGWTDRVATLRRYAAEAQSAAQVTSEILDDLRKVGLASFASAARHQDAETVQAGASDMLDANHALSPYLNFAVARAACKDHPVASPVLAAFEDGAERLHQLPEALEWLVAWAIVRRHAEANRPVFNRTGDQLSTHRQHFAAADRSRLATDAKLVQRAVIGQPVPGGSAHGSRKEWTDNALLQNEFAKQRRHVPVRDLLNRAGNAVLALTPCLMMSPLTVAQYLKPGGITFDVVVMDEASQIKPEDAIGAMLRGRQAVVVGDPKQLPPTNFFDRALDEAEEEDESGAEDKGPRLSVEDRVAAESVLDLATRAFRPARRLRWHYRSQHESLIAFSNREFYGNNLVVFPSSHAPSETLGIELVRVRGFWRERINQEEAKAVAAAAADFMRRHPKLSLGIVAMNQPQRDLIQAEIDAQVPGDAALAGYTEHWEERLEAPFVKNLENVQGDERDVIFISLGWGRTPERALHQRFYPVNRREDGHRRLNVLFTRAKRKIVLFSSLEAEDILVDPERTAPGVRILREYLAYARDGRLEQGRGEDSEGDSPFETSVANALRALGHDVALQVGVAGYRIDIAARHPAEPARFVVGIECDGAIYHSAKSARDRDRLRQDALEKLGWKLVRVWSTDWFRDPFGQAERLSNAIKSAISETVLDEKRRPRLVELADNEPAPAAAPAARQAVAAGKATTKEAELTGAAPPAPEPPAIAAKPQTLADALRAFREEVIMRDFPGSEPGRCILREAMIDAIVKSGLDEPEDFHNKIPEHLRSRTDGRQVIYLERICDVVAQHEVRA